MVVVEGEFGGDKSYDALVGVGLQVRWL